MPCESGAFGRQLLSSVPCAGHRVVNVTEAVPSDMKVLVGRADSK